MRQPNVLVSVLFIGKDGRKSSFGCENRSSSDGFDFQNIKNRFIFVENFTVVRSKTQFKETHL